MTIIQQITAKINQAAGCVEALEELYRVHLDVEPEAGMSAEDLEGDLRDFIKELRAAR